MFKKIAWGMVISSLVISCSSNKNNYSESQIGSHIPIASSPNKTMSSQPLVGGWVPVFFNSFDKTQLSSIADGMNRHQIKLAVISYPTKMQGLASQIHEYLQSATNKTITMNSVELKDTDQVKYNLKQVIVTLYFN